MHYRKCLFHLKKKLRFNTVILRWLKCWPTLAFGVPAFSFGRNLATVAEWSPMLSHHTPLVQCRGVFAGDWETAALWQKASPSTQWETLLCFHLEECIKQDLFSWGWGGNHQGFLQGENACLALETALLTSVGVAWVDWGQYCQGKSDNIVWFKSK